MNNKYKNIELSIGCSLEEAITKLKIYKKNNIKAKADFNGNILSTDKLDIDENFLMITGKNKNDFLKSIEEEVEKEERNKKNRLCLLKKKGKEFFKDDLLIKWNEVCEKRINFIYHGKELLCLIKIIEKIEKKASHEEVLKEFIEQNHSGMSSSLMFALLKEFNENGGKIIESYKKNYMI